MKKNIFIIVLGVIGLALISAFAPAIEGMEAVAAAKQVAKGGFESYVQARAEMAMWAKVAIVAKIFLGIVIGYNLGSALGKYLNARTKASLPQGYEG